MFQRKAVFSLFLLVILLLWAPASWTADTLFQQAVSYPASGHFTVGIKLADVNGDGKADAIVVHECVSLYNCDTGAVSILLGNGDGTFQTPHIYASGAWDTMSVAVADLNEDAKPDLILASQCLNLTAGVCDNGIISLMFGKGDGTFETPVTFSSGGLEAASVAVQDVNGDGKPDLLVANTCRDRASCTSITENGGVATVLLGNGNGTFKPAQAYAAGGYGTAFIAAADLNLDGKPDLVVANDYHHTVGVLIGNGDGTYQPVKTYQSGGKQPRALVIADFNGDGKPDVVVTNQHYVNDRAYGDRGRVGVLLGNGDGTLQSIRTYDAGAWFARAVTAADINADGKLDLLIATAGGVGLQIFLGNGDGSFQPALHRSAGGGGTNDVVAEDLTGDGKLDVITASNCGYGAACDEGVMGVLLAWFDPTIKLASSLNPSTYGQTVNLTTTMTWHGPGGIPTGNIVFKNGGTPIGTRMLVDGVATLTKFNLPVGNLAITATYMGDTQFAKAVSSVTGQVVNPATTSMTIKSSLNPSTVGQSVTFTAAITSPTAHATGSVVFMAGATPLGTVTISSGKARLTTSALPKGNTVITAIYAGTDNVVGSAESLTQKVQ
jgi:hypothetical protein